MTLQCPILFGPTGFRETNLIPRTPIEAIILNENKPNNNKRHIERVKTRTLTTRDVYSSRHCTAIVCRFI